MQINWLVEKFIQSEDFELYFAEETWPEREREVSNIKCRVVATNIIFSEPLSHHFRPSRSNTLFIWFSSNLLPYLCVSLPTNGCQYHAILSYTAELSGCSERVASMAHFEVEVKPGIS